MNGGAVGGVGKERIAGFRTAVVIYSNEFSSES